MGGKTRGRVRPGFVEAVCQGNRGGGRGAIMNQYVRAGSMHGARQLRAHAARTARDQYNLVTQRRILEGGRHAA